jgi:hypothetical protein
MLLVADSSMESAALHAYMYKSSLTSSFIICCSAHAVQAVYASTRFMCLPDHDTGSVLIVITHDSPVTLRQSKPDNDHDRIL